MFNQFAVSIEAHIGFGVVFLHGRHMLIDGLHQMLTPLARQREIWNTGPFQP